MATAEGSIGERTRPVSRRGKPRLLRLEAVLPLGLTVLVAFLVIYPIGMLVFGTFWSAAPGQPGTFTLENWAAVLSDRATFEVLLTSLAIAVPRTLLALLLATAFAWCIARTNIPCKRVLEGLLVFMFFLPELPWVLAWMLLGAPNVGLLNQWLGTLVSGGEGLINVYSYGGLIVLGAARSATVLFLFIHPAFLAMDATLEEAARMAGASGWRTLWRINLPLLMPALLASGILSFVVAMESFEIPQLLGTPANIFVFTTRIYDLAYGGHVANFGAAMVLALILLALTGSSDRCAVAAPARPVLHDRVRPRLQGATHRSRFRTMDRLRRHADLLCRFRRAAVCRAAVELVHGAERLHQLGHVHDDALEQRARP